MTFARGLGNGTEFLSELSTNRDSENLGSEGAISASELGTSASELGTSASEPKTSASEPETSASELGTSTSELGTSTSEPETSASELGTSTSELGTSTSEPETLSSEGGTSASEPETSSSEGGTSASEGGTSASERRNRDLHPLSSSGEERQSVSLAGWGSPVLGNNQADNIFQPVSSQDRSLETDFLDSVLNQLQKNEQRNLRTVLIFDQFEEFFFIYPQPAHRKRFFDFLGDCLHVLSVKVILSLRVDYLHYLLECNRLPSMKIIGNDILSQQQEPNLKQVMAELKKERTQRKISEAKLNSFLKRALFASVAAAVVLAGLTVTAWNAAKNAEEQRKQANINEIKALNNSSQVFFASRQYRDALTEALKAGVKLKNLSSSQKTSDIQILTVAKLRQAVYLQPNEKKENPATEIKTLEGDRDRVLSVAFSPSGQQLVSGGGNGSIIVWDLDLDNLLISGCKLLNNYLIVHPEVLEELKVCKIRNS